MAPSPGTGDKANYRHGSSNVDAVKDSIAPPDPARDFAGGPAFALK